GDDREGDAGGDDFGDKDGESAENDDDYQNAESDDDDDNADDDDDDDDDRDRATLDLLHETHELHAARLDHLRAEHASARDAEVAAQSALAADLAQRFETLRITLAEDAAARAQARIAAGRRALLDGVGRLFPPTTALRGAVDVGVQCVMDRYIGHASIAPDEKGETGSDASPPADDDDPTPSPLLPRRMAKSAPDNRPPRSTSGETRKPAPRSMSGVHRLPHHSPSKVVASASAEIPRPTSPESLSRKTVSFAP
ncbi:hypothetical protein BDK51DRAFT_45720, partial [Blyttiomyces helicus]